MDGPFSSLAGYGFHASAIAGFTDLTGWADLGPDGPWMAYTDTIAPRFLAATLLAALDVRRRTGQGCHIEGAQLEIGLQFLAPEVLEQQILGSTVSRNGNRDRHLAPQGAYPCAGDDEWCAVSVVDDGCWAALAPCARRPRMGDGTRARHHRRPAGRPRRARRPPRRVDVVSHRRGRRGVPARRRGACGQGAAHPRSAGRPADRAPRTSTVGSSHPEVGLVPYAGHQYRVRGYDHGPRTAAPMLGEHTDHVLRDLLGMSDDEIVEAALDDALR